MGQRGPVPNVEMDLARPRSRKGGDQQAVTYGVRKGVAIPEPDPDWHPIALMLWSSLEDSGQADFYQQSDWAMAYSICDDISHYKKSGKRSGQMLATIYSAMSSLLITEGDRRRVRMELTEPATDDDQPALAIVTNMRAQLEGAAKQGQ